MRCLGAIVLALAAPLVLAGPAPAQAPELVDPDLAVWVAASGLEQPVAMAFLHRDEMLVLEKHDVLDLAVVSTSR